MSRARQHLPLIILFQIDYNEVKFEEIVNDFTCEPPENVPPLVTSLKVVPPLTEPPVYNLYELPDVNSGKVM